MLNKETLDVRRVVDIEFDGIDHKDHPDYCDAFIISAFYEVLVGDRVVGLIDLTETEIELIEDEYPEWVYDKLMEVIF